MQKINILHYKMVIGGIETSLLNLVKSLNGKFDVEVYTLFPGPLDEQIECPHKNLLTEREDEIFNLKINNHKKNFKQTIKSALWGVGYLSGFLAKKLSKQIRKAEVNLCFLPSRIIIDITHNLKGKKLCFVHGDVSFVGLSKWKIKKLKCFKKIFAVSESCKNKIYSLYPMLNTKLDYIYNTQDNEEIVKKSEEFKVEFDKSKFNIVSCSRLSSEKGHIRSLTVFKKLLELGLDFVWHVVGDGNERAEIKKYIIENKMEKCIKLHGTQFNPYPYYRAADLFYLGSYHEAAPMVYAESMILGVPVFTTNTCSAKELVGDKGFVCENSEEGIYNGLKEILSNKKVVDEKRKNLKSFKYDNEAIVAKLIQVIE